MSDRERLEKLIGEAPTSIWHGSVMMGELADHLLAAGVTLPPAPPPVLEVTQEALAAYWRGAFGPDAGMTDSNKTASRKGLCASFSPLLRSCADGLTEEECEIVSAHLGLNSPDAVRVILRRVAARREA